MKKEKLPLAKFQRWMQQMLLDPTQPTNDDEEGRGAAILKIEDVIQPSQRLAPWQHLAIYQHGYTARLRDCMTKHFMALQHALGEELFQAFADEYLHRYPSESYNLANLGDRFAAFLEETRPDKDIEPKEEWPDFMIELAQFENTINHIFEEQIDQDYELATLTTADEQLKLIPGLHLFEFKFPVQPYYRSVVNGNDPELPAAVATYYAIFRRGFQLVFIDLQVAQYRLLQTFQQTASLTGIEESQLAEFWPRWKEKWIELGVLAEK